MSADDADIARFTLRVPQDMMEPMRRLAHEHHRSLHGEYIQAVQEYLEKHLVQELLDKQRPTSTRKRPTMSPQPIRRCPLCANLYVEHPALSRRDNKTEICPDCGMREALEDWARAQARTSNEKETS